MSRPRAQAHPEPSRRCEPHPLPCIDPLAIHPSYSCRRAPADGLTRTRVHVHTFELPLAVACSHRGVQSHARAHAHGSAFEVWRSPLRACPPPVDPCGHVFALLSSLHRPPPSSPPPRPPLRAVPSQPPSTSSHQHPPVQHAQGGASTVVRRAAQGSTVVRIARHVDHYESGRHR